MSLKSTYGYLAVHVLSGSRQGWITWQASGSRTRAGGMTGVPYGQGSRMLSVGDLCAWLNITEGHARKLVERDAIPYRKVGHLIRFPEAEIEEWSRPAPRQPRRRAERGHPAGQITPGRSRSRPALPKSLID